MDMKHSTLINNQKIQTEIFCSYTKCFKKLPDFDDNDSILNLPTVMFVVIFRGGKYTIYDFTQKIFDYKMNYINCIKLQQNV